MSDFCSLPRAQAVTSGTEELRLCSSCGTAAYYIQEYCHCVKWSALREGNGVLPDLVLAASNAAGNIESAMKSAPRVPDVIRVASNVHTASAYLGAVDNSVAQPLANA